MSLTQMACDSIVRRHLPRGWRYYIKCSMAGRGQCLFSRWLILLKQPVRTRNDLVVFLHEVGHVQCRHQRHKIPRHIEEYEAERYAMLALRHEGIPYPREEIVHAKNNVRDCIKEDRKLGIKIDPKIARWAR